MTDDQAIGAERSRLMRLATYASVSVAVFLIAIKLYAWILTDSVSLLSTLVDSVLDAGASLINLFAVHYALQPADKDHRFGHGKAEPLAGLVQSGFIFASALFLIFETGLRFLHPQEIEQGHVGMTVMGISLVMTLGLVSFQRFVIARTQSVAVSADSLHYVTDVLVNAGVLIALFVIMQTGWHWVDPMIAALIALYILWSVREIAKKALSYLMDQEFSKEERQNILTIARANEAVIGVHDLRTRSSGQQSFIQLHLVLNGNLSLHEAHVISDQVESDLSQAYPDAEILIHQDPHNIVEDIQTFS